MLAWPKNLYKTINNLINTFCVVVCSFNQGFPKCFCIVFQLKKQLLNKLLAIRTEQKKPNHFLKEQFNVLCFEIMIELLFQFKNDLKHLLDLNFLIFVCLFAVPTLKNTDLYC